LIGKTRKTAAVVLLALAISLALSLFAFKPTSAVSPVAGHWEADLPGAFGGYNGSKQFFLVMFPEFEAKNVHYKNPNLGPEDQPQSRATLILDAAYLKAKSDIEEETLHLTARHLKLQVLLSFITLFEASGDYVELDVDLHEPDFLDPSGTFGTLTATFRGNVKLDTPGFMMPIAEFDYEGPQLTVVLTLKE